MSSIGPRRFCALIALSLLAAACGSGAQASQTLIPPRPVLHESTPATDGSDSTVQGYVFDSSMAELGPDHVYQFRILGPDGTPQTRFVLDQTKLVHFLGVRDDLTDFIHVHPRMAPDGTWTVVVPFESSGPHQVYVDFMLQDAFASIHHLVLRRTLMVPGPYKLSPILPAPSLSGTSDGYTFTFERQPKPWTVMLLPAHVTLNGQPVKDLQPYLATYAHFTAVSMTGHLYGHAHPLEYAGTGYDQTKPGWDGGPNLTFHAEFPGAGDYRTFVEFQTGGVLHTVAMTIHVA